MKEISTFIRAEAEGSWTPQTSWLGLIEQAMALVSVLYEWEVVYLDFAVGVA